MRKAFAVFAFMGLGGLPFSGWAAEAVPISAVAEVFIDSKNSCGYNETGEAELKNIEASAPDVLVLTCQDRYVKEPKLLKDEQEAYGGYCLKRKVEYAGAHNMHAFNIAMVVVNGRYDLNAAYPAQIPAGVKMARSFSELGPIALSLTQQGALSYTFSPEIENTARALGGDYKAMLVAYRPEVELKEGDLRSVVNPVTAVRDLGAWDKNPQSFSIPLAGLEHGELAVLLQQQPYGPIIAAGRIEYP